MREGRCSTYPAIKIPEGFSSRSWREIVIYFNPSYSGIVLLKAGSD